MVLIDINDREILDALNNLLQTAQNPRPALFAIADGLMESTKQRFVVKTAPDGT